MNNIIMWWMLSHDMISGGLIKSYGGDQLEAAESKRMLSIALRLALAVTIPLSLHLLPMVTKIHQQSNAVGLTAIFLVCIALERWASYSSFGTALRRLHGFTRMEWKDFLQLTIDDLQKMADDLLVSCAFNVLVQQAGVGNDHRDSKWARKQFKKAWKICRRFKMADKTYTKYFDKAREQYFGKFGRHYEPFSVI